MCVCGNEDTTTLPMKCARPSVVVVAGVRIVRSHAILNDVINVRIVECHESINVVIGIRVVLCQPLEHNFGFSSYFSMWPFCAHFCIEEIRHLKCGMYTTRR